MEDEYPIPAQSVRVRQTVRRSLFITTLAHAPHPDAARSFVQRVQREFADASHNVWAYVAGPPGASAAIGCSDDGEPSGAAGKPMLNILLHAPVGETAAVTTRYFGGVKLGIGGLVRAYAGGVKAALNQLPTQRKVNETRVQVIVGYGALAPLKRGLPSFNARIECADYREQATLRLVLPRRRCAELRQWLMDLTRGRGLVSEAPARRDAE